MLGGALCIVQIVTAAAVERQSGIVTIELEPERQGFHSAAMLEFHQPHLERTISCERNGP
jgi:hypothetical protein